MGFRVWGFGFGVWVLGRGLRVWDLVFVVFRGLGFGGAEGFGSGVWVIGFGV